MSCSVSGRTSWALEVRDLDGGQTLAQGRQAARWRAAHPEGPGEESAQVPIPGGGNLALLAHPGHHPVQEPALLHHLGGLILRPLGYEPYDGVSPVSGVPARLDDLLGGGAGIAGIVHRLP
jgi:hypothetical protein